MGKIYVFLAVAFCSFGVVGYCIWADEAEHDTSFRMENIDYSNDMEIVQETDGFSVPEDSDVLPYIQSAQAPPVVQVSVVSNRKEKNITRIEVAIVMPNTGIPRVTIGNSILRQEFWEAEETGLEFADSTLLPLAVRNTEMNATVFIKCFFYGSSSKPGT